jgi:hypothetical protein
MAEETYQWVKSKASCKLNSIKGIMFGGISSRFWMLRKHINSVPIENHKLGKVPFYSWECITLVLEERDVDLVIQNEDDMMRLINLIVYYIKTQDNNKNSAATL